jgi:hypothetical protein
MQFIYIWKLLYIFLMVLPPIIRSAYNCVYIILYLSRRYCYLPLSWKGWNWFQYVVVGVRHVVYGRINIVSVHGFETYVILIITCNVIIAITLTSAKGYWVEEVKRNQIKLCESDPTGGGTCACFLGLTNSDQTLRARMLYYLNLNIDNTKLEIVLDLSIRLT